MKSIQPVSPYSMIWGWLKNSVFTMCMAIILSVTMLNVFMTLVNMEMSEQRERQLHEKMILQEEKHQTLIMSLVHEMISYRQRWDYEVSAAADIRRARLWQKRDKRFRRNYLKNLRRLKRKYPELEGIYDKKWSY